VAAFKESDVALKIKLPLETGTAKGKAKKTAKPSKKSTLAQNIEPPSQIVTSLKAWRIAEAKSRSVPAFTILTDRSLNEIAIANPKNLMELQSVYGMGPKLVEKHGAAILKVLNLNNS
jgi:ribonuclease D